MKNVLLNTFVFITISLAFTMLGLFAYWFYAPVKVFEIKEIYMLTPVVRAGSDAIYFVDYCRYFSGNIHVFKSLDGASLIYSPEVVNSNPPGCRTAEVVFNVPSYALPGTYRIKVVSEAQVNPIRTATVRFETNDFKVLPVDTDSERFRVE